MRSLLRKFVSATVALVMLMSLFSANVGLAATDSIIPMGVHINAEKNADSTQNISEVEAFGETEVYFNVDNPNPTFESQEYNLNTYQLRVYYDPTYFTLKNTTTPFDTDVPFEGIVQPAYENPSADSSLVTVNRPSTQGETIDYSGREYYSAFVTCILSNGTGFPDNSTGSQWYSLAGLPLVSTGKVGTTNVFIETADTSEQGGGLLLIPRHSDTTPKTFKPSVQFEGMHTIKVLPVEAPGVPVASVTPGAFNQQQKIALSKAQKDINDSNVKIKYKLSTSATNTEIEYQGEEITVSRTTTITAWTEKTINSNVYSSRKQEWIYRIVPFAPKACVVGEDGVTLSPSEVTRAYYSTTAKVWLDINGDTNPSTPTDEVAQSILMYYTFADIDKAQTSNPGSDPNSSWVLATHKKVVDVSKTSVLKVVAYNGNEFSDVMQYYFYIMPDKVTANYASGQYTGGISNLTLDYSNPLAKIYYTVDGTNPSDSKTAILYQRNTYIPISSTTYLRAVAKLNGQPGLASSWNFFVPTVSQDAYNPIILPVGNVQESGSISYTKPQTITITTSNSDCSIYYTLDGSDPTNSATRDLYSSNAITINSNVCLKVAVQKSGTYVSQKTYWYKIKPDKPVMSLISGIYNTSKATNFVDSNSQGEIWYTLDGTDPDVPANNPTLYTGNAINISATTTVKSVKKVNGVYSEIATYVYRIETSTVPMPQVSLGNDSMEWVKSIDTSTTFNFKSLPNYYNIYYSIVGQPAYSLLSDDSSLYGNETYQLYIPGTDIPITGETIIRAYTTYTDSSGNVIKSPLATFNYMVIPAAPIAAPSQTYSTPFQLNITGYGDRFYYTKASSTDGTLPHAPDVIVDRKNKSADAMVYVPNVSEVQNPAEWVSQRIGEGVADREIVEVKIAAEKDGIFSDTSTYLYVIQKPLPSETVLPVKPYASLPSGYYEESIPVKLFTPESGNTISYRINGGPWMDGNVSGDEIQVATSSKIDIKSVSVTGESDVVSYSYTIKPSLPILIYKDGATWKQMPTGSYLIDKIPGTETWDYGNLANLKIGYFNGQEYVPVEDNSPFVAYYINSDSAEEEMRNGVFDIKQMLNKSQWYDKDISGNDLYLPIDSTVKYYMSIYYKDDSAKSDTAVYLYEINKAGEVHAEPYTINQKNYTYDALGQGITLKTDNSDDIIMYKVERYKKSGWVADTNSFIEFDPNVKIIAHLEDMVIRVTAKIKGSNTEAVFEYRLKPENPVAYPSGAAILDSTNKVFLSVGTPSSSVYYTINYLDGHNPVTIKTKYDPNNPLNLLPGKWKIDAISVRDFLDENDHYSVASDNVVFIYNVKPNLSITAGQMNYEQKTPVEITATENSDIFYTTDGSTPNPDTVNQQGSATFKYTGTLYLEQTTTIKAVSVYQGVASDVVTQTISNIKKPVLTANPSGGMITSSTDIVLSADSGASIYYTTDGSIPKTDGTSNMYTSPLRFSLATTLKAIAVLNGVSSDIQTYSYTIYSGGSGGGGGGGGGGSSYVKPVTTVVQTADSKHLSYLYGYEDGTIRIENPISRQETAALLFRLTEDAQKSITAPTGDIYKDVSVLDWSAQSIEYLYSKKVLSLSADMLFRPTDNITRAEFVKMICEWKGISTATVTNDKADYKDHWAGEYIQGLINAGIINGYEDGTFKPDNEIIRAEAIAILNRVLGRIPNRNIINSMNIVNFKDLDKNYWAYYDILEATINHTYVINTTTKYEDWKQVFVAQ